MTDNTNDNPASEASDSFLPEMEIKGDGLLWHLRDNASLFIKMHKDHMSSMVQVWQDTPQRVEWAGTFWGLILADTFRDRIIKKAKAKFGSSAPHIAEDIESVANILGVPQDSGKNLLEELREASQRSPVDRLIIYARSAANFFHNKEQEAFASIERDEHEETYELESPRFKLWLRSEYWAREKERLEDAALVEAGPLFEGRVRADLPDVIRDQNLTDAINQLESIAIFDGEEHEVYIRTAQHEGVFYVDLGDLQWRTIQISCDGWQIVPGKDVPVRFVRPKGLQALPEPLPPEKGKFEAIENVLNLGPGVEGKRNKLLILSWLTYCLLPNGPYPIVNISGPQGSAKTTTVISLRQLIDPNTAPKGTKPKNEHDTYIDAAANWVLAYDQLVSIPVWFSNVLCDVATGGGYRTRTLYSNRDQEIFNDTRPIVVSGIGNIASRPDFLERSLMIALPRVGEKQRKLERVVKRRLRAAHPEILTALLNATVIGLNNTDSVVQEKLPRMADFFVWGCAVAEGLGEAEKDFRDAFQGSSEDATDVSLEEWAVTDTFIDFARQHQGEENAWKGYPQELYDRLTGDGANRGKQWPGSASALSREDSRTPEVQHRHRKGQGSGAPQDDHL